MHNQKKKWKMKENKIVVLLAATMMSMSDNNHKAKLFWWLQELQLHNPIQGSQSQRAPLWRKN